MSDDSDRASDLASEHDEADDLELDEDQSESEAEEANGFLDIEAYESNEESEHEMGSDFDQDEIHFFPQFCRLPIELREHIWEFFDPDLKSPGRVLEFLFMPMRSVGFELWESATLEQQTGPARAILATHRESRLLALKSYPHSLPLRGKRGVVRFNGENDIIFITKFWAKDVDVDALEAEMGGSDPFKDIKHLAMDRHIFPYLSASEGLEGVHAHNRPVFTNVKTWFYCEEFFAFPAWKLRWCASDKARKFHLQTEEEEPGVGEDLGYLYCWPDLKQHGEHEFAQDNIIIKLREKQNDLDLDGGVEEVRRDTIIEKRRFKFSNGTFDFEAYPLILFAFENGMHAYHKIKEAVHSGGDIGGSWVALLDDSESGSDQDDYESDGIDDATIDESDNSSEEDDDLALGLPETDYASIFNGFSPLEPESPGAYDSDGPASDEEPMPNLNGFLPLQAESPDAHASDGSASDDEPVRGVKRQRRIVTSDSEDEDALEDRPRKRQHVHAVIDSDDDEEDDDDVVPHSRRFGRALKTSGAMIDEDSEEASGTEVSEDRPRKRRTRAVIDSEDGDDDTEVGEQNGVGLDSDSDEESEDTSDEEQDQRRRQSLAERLQLFRSQNPVSPSQSGSDRDFDNDDMAGGYEADDYAGIEDGEGVDEFDEYGEDGEDGDDQILDMDDQYPDEGNGAW